MHLYTIALVVLIATVASVSAQCDLAPVGLTRWSGTTAALENCLNTVPLVTTAHNKAISNIGKALAAHAFSDIASANLSPYNVNVDVAGIWDTISTTTYANDWAAQKAIISLFNSLGDAHLQYHAPAGYGNFYYYAPFALSSRWVGGVQKIYAIQGSFDTSLWNAGCGCTDNIGNYWGEEVTHIDDTPVLDWLASFGTSQGIYMDRGVKITNALYWAGYSIYINTNTFPASGSIKYTLSTSGEVTFNLMVISANLITSVNDIIAMNSPAKRDGYGQDATLMLEEQLLVDLEAAIAKTSRARDALTVRLRSNAMEAAAEIRALHARSADYRLKFDEASKKRDFNMESWAANNYSPLPHVRLARTKFLRTALMDLENGIDRDAVIANNRRLVDESIAKQYGSKHVAGSEDQASNRRAANGGSAVTKPVLAGNPTLFSTIASGGNDAKAEMYNNTVVLSLFAFDTDGFEASVKAAHTSHGSATNLIIDVTQNGGGLVCLNFGTLAYLISPWRDGALSGPDVLFSPYDWRRSEMTDVLFNEDHTWWSFTNTQTNPHTGALMDDTALLTARDITYGSQTSTYSQLFNWNPGCVDGTYWYAETASYTFDKIIVLTDGRCGSSCAYFVSQLRWANKVRVVSYGGEASSPLATSSFAGGNVWNWESLTTRAISQGYSATAGLQFFETNAYLSFNMRANYDYDSTLPRQFERLEADWYLPTWDFLEFAIDDTLRADLYSSVIPLFNEMEGGLPSIANSQAPDGTIVITPVADSPPSGSPPSGGPPSGSPSSETPTGAAASLSPMAALAFLATFALALL